jgi:hypothetical protein
MNPALGDRGILIGYWILVRIRTWDAVEKQRRLSKDLRLWQWGSSMNLLTAESGFAKLVFSMSGMEKDYGAKNVDVISRRRPE